MYLQTATVPQVDGNGLTRPVVEVLALRLFDDTEKEMLLRLARKLRRSESAVESV
jgi:hypothetical protein